MHARARERVFPFLFFLRLDLIQEDPNKTTKTQAECATIIQALARGVAGREWVSKFKTKLVEQIKLDLLAGKLDVSRGLSLLQLESKLLTKLKKELKEVKKCKAQAYDSEVLGQRYIMKGRKSQKRYLTRQLESGIRKELTRLVIEQEEARLARERHAAEEFKIDAKWIAELKSYGMPVKGGKGGRINLSAGDSFVCTDGVNTFEDVVLPKDGTYYATRAARQNAQKKLFRIHVAAAVREKAEEWRDLMNKGWITKEVFVQWSVKAFLHNAPSASKRAIGWAVIKDMFDPVEGGKGGPEFGVVERRARVMVASEDLVPSKKGEKVSSRKDNKPGAITTASKEDSKGSGVPSTMSTMIGSLRSKVGALSGFLHGTTDSDDDEEEEDEEEEGKEAEDGHVGTDGEKYDDEEGKPLKMNAKQRKKHEKRLRDSMRAAVAQQRRLDAMDVNERLAAQKERADREILSMCWATYNETRKGSQPMDRRQRHNFFLDTLETKEEIEAREKSVLESKRKARRRSKRATTRG